MSHGRRIRIGIEDDGVIYKVTSIYLGSDGSFKIDVPYCKYDKGLITKAEASYKSGMQMSPVVQEFSIKNRPQLSIHASGFVQFSGKGIISGIDEKTGKIKGMGLKSSPLSDPIRSGPTFGIQIWGLKEAYEVAENKDECDLIYHRSDFITKVTDSDGKSDMFIIEGWIFPGAHMLTKSRVWEVNGFEKITFSFPQYIHCPGAIFSPDIIRLRNHNSFIGLLPFLTKASLSDKATYGFVFGGPTEYVEGDIPKRHIMMAISRDVWNSTKVMSSLDYQI